MILDGDKVGKKFEFPLERTFLSNFNGTSQAENYGYTVPAGTLKKAADAVPRRCRWDWFQVSKHPRRQDGGLEEQRGAKGKGYLDLEYASRWPAGGVGAPGTAFTARARRVLGSVSSYAEAAEATLCVP